MTLDELTTLDDPIGSVHVIDLTDEELLGLDGPDSDQVAPTPWLSGHTDDEIVVAAEVGLRSLVTHGRADVDEDGATLTDDLCAILGLRHDARAIVYADHSTPTRQETRLLYIHPHAVLTEGVNGAGIHRFEVGDLESALRELVPWCRPREHDGSPGRLEGEDIPAELEGLQAVVSVDAVGLRGGEDVVTFSATFFRLSGGDVVEFVEQESQDPDLLPRTQDEVGERVRGCVLDALGDQVSRTWSSPISAATGTEPSLTDPRSSD